MNHNTILSIPIGWGTLETGAICDKDGYVLCRPTNDFSRESWNFLMHAVNNYEILVKTLQRCMTEYVGEFDNEHFICKALIKADELFYHA